MVHPRLAGQAAVHDHPHPGHGQRGLGDRGGEDHPSAVGSGEHRVLHGGRGPAVHLEHLDPGQIAQLPCHAGDFTHAGQEAEHVAVPLGQRPAHRGGHVREQGRVHAHAVRRPDRLRGRRPHHPDRVRDAGRLDDRCVPEQLGPALGVRRRGSRHQAELGPQCGPYVEEEGGDGVRVEMALVAFVEDDDVDPGQLLVALQALEEHTGGDDLDDGVRADGPLAPHGEADLRARPLAEQPGHPAGGRPGRDPARLGDYDPPRRAVPDQAREDQRYEGGLAGAGRGAQHRRPVLVERGQQLGHGLTDRESVECVGSDHALSVVRPAGPCDALSTGTVGSYD